MQTGSVSNYAEELALRTVIDPVIQSSAQHLVHANYPVQLSDGSSRILDFALISAVSRIAIEIDGYAYHAEGAIPRQKFDDQLDRQNELILGGWQLVRFSFDQIRRDPAKCQDILRRLIVSDPQLHRNFATDGVLPSALQLEVLDSLDAARATGKRRGLVAIPTGTGKTIMSALDSKRVPGRILFIVHSNEILKQAASTYRRIHPTATVGFIHSGVEVKGYAEDMIFANIASLRSTHVLEQFVHEHFSYIVVDEFHHAAAASYATVLNYFRPKFLLGLTATPSRTDNKNILELLDGNLLYAIGTSEAIDRGFLVPFTYFGLVDNVDYSGVRHNGYRYDINDLERCLLIPRRDEAIIEKYLELARGMKTIGFCVSILHADRMAEIFSAKGITSVSVHSKLNTAQRAHRIQAFQKGDATCIFVRDLFNEGVDFPDTQALLFLRPTESKIVFQQQLGRGMRLSPQKKNVRVLDFIGNYLGAGQVPMLVRGLASGQKTDNHDFKPELVYDNGCRVIFHEKAIEQLILPDFQVIKVPDLVSRVFVLYEKLSRSLTPIDLFMAIRQFGSYRTLVERMNTIDEREVVLDPSFISFDPSEAMQGSESRLLIEARACDVFRMFEDLLYAIAEFNATPVSKPRSGRGRRLGRQVPDAFQQHANVIHSLTAEIRDLLAQVCLLRTTIMVYADECGNLPPIQVVPAPDQKQDIFYYLAQHSKLRNSFAVANFLRAEYEQFRLMISNLAQLGSGKEIVLLRDVLSRKSIEWLIDLHQITSSDSLA